MPSYRRRREEISHVRHRKTGVFARVARLLFAALALPWATAPARAADPIKVGFSMALTGAVAPNGKQLLLALEIWRDDVNAKGGHHGPPGRAHLLRRPEQPATTCPAIYTKLLSVDKVDLLLGPYATNMIAPAMPVIMQPNKMTIGMLGVNINRQFNYSRYFSMIPGGDEGTLAFSRGWFELATAQNPQAEDGRARGRRRGIRPHRLRRRARQRQERRLDIVYDKSYPPGTHRPHADRARGAGHQSGPHLRVRLSARHGRRSCAPPTRSTSTPRCWAAPWSGCSPRRSRCSSGRC